MTLEVMSPTAALLDGRYLLHDRVGRGGMATVYRADDTHLGRTVAIKMIHESQGPVASIERAHTEKALLASLSHPSLVTLHDAQLAPGRPQYLVMEFVDGPTLAERMAAGPLPPQDVARLTRDLAEGLTAVHGAGIVHRDVKPSNVLLARGRAGRPFAAKLADFGIACTLGDPRLTTPGIVLGTLTYMAPEQLRDAEPGTAVDIFSLGLILIEALSGTPGYASLGSGRAAAIARLMNPPTISETVPREWRDLLERMTRLEPEERPDAIDVAREARQLLRGYATGSHRAAVAASAAGAASVVDPGAGGGEISDAGDAPGTQLPDAVGLPRDGATPDARGDVTDPDSAQRATSAETAVLPPAESPRSHAHTRRRVVAGAAGAVAAGALVAGFSLMAAPATDLGRVVSAQVMRAEVTPIAPPTDDGATTPVEVAADPDDSGTDDKPGNSGNPGNGNSGNSGSGNPGNGNPGNGENSGKSDGE
ncbi:hypothetical protein JOF42_000745 [Microbacterium phyllosphaerae]|uniref:non-specific serine/threonine protein kinase n=1 Tax=Microbacterium phyllosphaerae TaxID=124798 RepID=A0ABS4WM22_9MICO|nr:serine/threonine-protein kinase [Microbacterium phyllosphaerae]MBP2377250.1 hypothetical protein [Microbacterium phyllosphaerae]